MDKQLIKLIKQKRNNAYNDPQSILGKYDEYLEKNGIYHSVNEEVFFASIKGKKNLCDFTLSMIYEAIYDNEKEFLLNCLLQMGYESDSLVEIVLDIFKEQKQNKNLWNYADFLYSLKNYKYLDEYIKIIMDKRYGTSREMLILLVGESKMEKVVPYLVKLSRDVEVVGHTLVALSNYVNDEIIAIMKTYTKHKKKWISDVANKYLKENYQTIKEQL